MIGLTPIEICGDNPSDDCYKSPDFCTDLQTSPDTLKSDISTNYTVSNQLPAIIQGPGPTNLDGKWRDMVFITNNFAWSAATIAALYKARWEVELLFKELKQTLQLQDFYQSNAVFIGV